MYKPFVVYFNEIIFLNFNFACPLYLENIASINCKTSMLAIV